MNSYMGVINDKKKNVRELIISGKILKAVQIEFVYKWMTSYKKNTENSKQTNEVGLGRTRCDEASHPTRPEY